MFGKKKKTPSIDLQRVLTAAVESAFGENGDRGNTAERQGNGASHDHRFGGAAAVVTGVVIAAAARAAYKRVRNVDLGQVAEAAEQRLQGRDS